MKKKSVIAIIVVLLVLSVLLVYNNFSEKEVVNIDNVKSTHVMQERIDGNTDVKGMTFGGYADITNEHVKAFFEKLNEADKRPVARKIKKVQKEFKDCEYFRQIIIEMKDGTSTYVYYGFSENEKEKLPVYSFNKAETCYIYSDDTLVEAMDKMIDSYTASAK